MEASKTKGLIVVLSAPSGGGKTTLVHELLSRISHSKRGITMTTRPPRKTEIDKQDYLFVNDDEFKALIEKKGFAEWAKVHSYYYGIPNDIIDKALENGQTLFLTIDVQGAETIKKHYPQALTIFMNPPDFDVLETRLRKRGTETDEQIRSRLEIARREIARSSEFDFVVLNDSLERAALEIQSIITQAQQQA